MLQIIFTLDYEIHGNGEGCPRALMVEPTDRLLRLFEKYGAKLTIMADVAEIMKFREYKEKVGRDDYHYVLIENQLRSALLRGHDVQLHIHSSYFRAYHDQGRWRQDWSEYDFAKLSYGRIDWMIRNGKEYLESILKPVDPNYHCIAFRAANWSVNPSKYIVQALLANGIKIDTSVFKNGYRKGLVSFDYSLAHHHFMPWRANPEDICRQDDTSPLWEFPIYSENRSIHAFMSANRFYRAVLSKLHKVEGDSAIPRNPQDKMKDKLQSLFGIFKKYAWKADFNQCSGRQLIQALLRGKNQVPESLDAPFILIGHSKLFNRWNEYSLRSFLRFIQEHTSWSGYCTLGHYAGI